MHLFLKSGHLSWRVLAAILLAEQKDFSYFGKRHKRNIFVIFCLFSNWAIGLEGDVV